MTQKNRWIGVVATLAMLASPAYADDATKTARDAYSKGRDAFAADRYREASTELTKSWDLVHMPDTALWAAKANEKLGGLVAAANLYRQSIALVADATWPKEPWMVQRQRKAQEEAKVNLDALLPRIPTLTIEITGETLGGFEVAIDQIAFPQGNLAKPHEIDPGTHTVSVTRAGEQPLSKIVTLVEGERRIVPFELGPSSAPVQPPAGDPPTIPVRPAIVMSPPSGHVTPRKPEERKTILPTIGWVGVGVGAAGLAVGATAAVVARNIMNTASCDGDNSCLEYDRYHESYNGWRAASTVGFVVGGVGVATAAVSWFVLKPKGQQAAHVSMTLGPGSVGMHGVF